MTLRIDDTDRYDRLRLLADCDPERLRAATVLVAGVGALGNEVAKTCALLGIGRILCFDRDTVAVSNLTRSVLFRAADAGRAKAEVAAERVGALNPDVIAVALVGDLDGGLGLGTVSECDLVFGCVDSREARVSLNAMCWRAGVPLVDGALGDLSGTVRTFVPPDGPCYECGLTETDWQVLSTRQPCGLLGQAAIREGRTPTTPMAASAIGAFQVQAALELLGGDTEHAGSAMVWNGRGPTLYRTRLPARSECLAHDTWPTPIATRLRAADATPADVIAVAGPHLQALHGGAAGTPEVRLQREWIASATCVDCGVTTDVRRPWGDVHREGRGGACGDCGGLREPTTLYALGAENPHASVPLAALGVAPDDVVAVEAAGARVMVRLMGDRLPVFADDASGALPSGADATSDGSPT